VLVGATHIAALVSAYLIFFFLSLFCLFPVGLGEVDPQSGAPLSPRFGLKALIAAGIATVLWLGFYALIAFKVVDL
jgi:predicted secreted protein